MQRAWFGHDHVELEAGCWALAVGLELDEIGFEVEVGVLSDPPLDVEDGNSGSRNARGAPLNCIIRFDVGHTVVLRVSIRITVRTDGTDSSVDMLDSLPGYSEGVPW